MVKVLFDLTTKKTTDDFTKLCFQGQRRIEVMLQKKSNNIDRKQEMT